ncbi:MAG: hypothetical protein QM831_45730 [Kofleriaceae bacterium]
MRHSLALLALAGCDYVIGINNDVPVRIGDAFIMHDEDHDGIDDARDPCPADAEDPPNDSDGDGVGEACDPDNGQQNTIARFDSFVANDGFTFPSTWSIENDVLSTTNTMSKAQSPIEQSGGAIDARIQDITVPQAMDGNVALLAFVGGIEIRCNIERTADNSVLLEGVLNGTTVGIATLASSVKLRVLLRVITNTRAECSVPRDSAYVEITGDFEPTITDYGIAADNAATTVSSITVFGVK